MENADRIVNLLAIILLHSLKRRKISKKIRQLKVAGFSELEIANLLQISIKELKTKLNKWTSPTSA